MTYIENVFLCIASPLLIATLCMGKRQRKFFLFCLAGMGACLLSAYINTFFAALYRADTFTTTTEIAPVVEEVMKFLPLLFYLLIFEPKREQIKNTAVVIALSFATFENVCYLIQNGAGHFSFIFFRGIGTGAMHVICGAIVGGGLAYVWQRTWLKIAETAPKSGKSGYIIVSNCGKSVFPLPGSVQAADKQYTVLHYRRRSGDYKLHER